MLYHLTGEILFPSKNSFRFDGSECKHWCFEKIKKSY